MSSETQEITYLGRNIKDLSKEDLIEVIHQIYKELDYFKSQYFKSENSKIELMQDMIKLKFNK